MSETIEPVYRTDPYARELPAMVVGHTEEGGVILDQSIFYPTGGGQPGDSGVARAAGFAPGEPSAPPAGAPVAAEGPEAQRKEKKKKISLKTLPQLGKGGPRVRQQEPPRLPPAPVPAPAKAKKAAKHTTPPEYWKGGGGSGLWTVSPESGGTKSPGSIPRTVA